MMTLRPLFSALLCSFLAACSSGQVRDTLGIGSRAPNEFNVVSLPPLSIPPEFYLTPPVPGAPPRQIGSQSDVARRAVLQQGNPAQQTSALLPPPSQQSLFSLGAAENAATKDSLDDFMAMGDDVAQTRVMPVESADLPSAAESRLLSKLGVDDADPSIRTLLFEESRQPETVDSGSPLGNWLGLGGKADGNVIDASREAERIRDNIEEGVPVNEGEVATQGDGAPKSFVDQLLE